jgi:hypothetical protein
MWRPNNLQWWFLVVVAVVVVCAWPPREGRSLAVTFVNWAVDPFDELPILPPPLGFGLGDDPEAVNARDMQVQQYDALYLQGGWTRRRLTLKVANDPFDPSTVRQLLTGAGVLAGLVAWRLGGRKV